MFKDFTVSVPLVKGKIVFQKTKNGPYVLYEYDRVYHKDRQYTVPKRVCVGKLDSEDSTKMHPNENYYIHFKEEAAIEVPLFTDGRSSCLKAGAFMLVRHILQKNKIYKWIMDNFKDDAGGLVIDLATYMLVSEENTAQHYPDYAYNHPLFSSEMKIYTDSVVCKLLKDVITRDDIIDFTSWWNSGVDHRKKIYISYDSTNKYSQAGDIDLVEPGHPKDGDNGDPVFNVSIAMDPSRSRPLFYEDYPGSIVDVSQLYSATDKAHALGYRNIGFILDRGYFSKNNILYLDENKYSFVIMAKGKKKFISSIVLREKGSFEDNRGCFIWQYEVYGTTVSAKLYKEDEKERYFHIYYSPERYSEEVHKLNLKIVKLTKELERLKGRKEEDINENKYGEYFELTFSPDTKKLLMFKERQEVIERYTKLCGYFCIISSDKMNAEEALLLYKSRDASEKLFTSDKTFLGSRSERVQHESSLRSKLFIEFIALIVRSSIYYDISQYVASTKIRRNYLNVRSVIKELEKMELVRLTDGIYRLDHAITARQKEILSIFGLDEELAKTCFKKISADLITIDKRKAKGQIKDPAVRDDSQVENEEEMEWEDQ